MSKIVEQLNNSIPSISTPMMKGDNLAIVLCTVFDDGREETADDNGWSIAARNGYEEVIAAIRDHYKPAADTIIALRAENEKLRAALLAFAKHFGPLEDNTMLHEGARECFRLARAALEEKP